MNDYIRERQVQRKREYHRKWRAEHKDSVNASQMRYWTKKAAEIRNLELPADADPEHSNSN